MKKVIYGVELDFSDEDVIVTPKGKVYIVGDSDPYRGWADYDHEIRCDILEYTARFRGAEIEVSYVGELDITVEARVDYDNGESYSYTGWGTCASTLYNEDDVDIYWRDQSEYQLAIVDAINNAYAKVMSHTRRALENKAKVAT